jgi:hypothetical protein
MPRVSTDQNAVPVPAAGFRRLNQQQHLTLEEVRGQAAEHALGEEGGVPGKPIENPLVFELLHVSLHVLEGLLVFRTDFVDQLSVNNDARA